MPQNLIAIKIAQSAVLAAASTVASAVSIAIQLSWLTNRVRVFSNRVNRAVFCGRIAIAILTLA